MTAQNSRYSNHFEDVAYYRYRVAAVRLDENCNPLKGSYSDWLRVNPPPTCVNVGPSAHWLFPLSNFLSGLSTGYTSHTCDENLETTEASIGGSGYV